MKITHNFQPYNIIKFMMISIIPFSYSYASQDANQIVGSIQGGQYPDTSILRSNATYPADLWFVIRKGDLIRSNVDKPVTIEIDLCSESINIDLKGHSQYVFEAGCKSKQAAISGWFLEFIASPLDNIYKSNYTEREPKPAYTRNYGETSKIKTPLMPSVQSLITPGDKSLSIRWLGGMPPFTITLSKNGFTVAELSNVNDAFIKLPSNHYSLNEKYKLHIIDSKDSASTKKLNVVNLPAKPKWYGEIGSLPEKDKELVNAIWLHDYSSDRRWSLEAYNVIIGRKDTPATLVLEAIENDEDLNIPW